MTEALKRLSALVDEIDTLCENAEKEKDAISEIIEENKEHEYLIFCTKLAPYYEIAKQVKRTVRVQINVFSNYISGCYAMKYTIELGDFGVRISIGNIPYYHLTNGKFVLWDEFDDHDQETIYKIAKKIDWSLFEKNFAEAVEEELTIRAKLANENLADAKKRLEETEL